MNELSATPKSMKKVIHTGIRKSLLELGSATKVELSNTLDISFPTISKFLSQMERDGEIYLVGLDDSSGGRRAKRYSYNAEYMLGLSIFLERTETNYTIFNCAGEIKETGTVQSVLKDDDLTSLNGCIESIMAKYPKISSIAIGVPGSVDNGRIFYIPGYDSLQNFDLKKYYEDRFSIPVVVENDMNAAVLGYHFNMGMTEKHSLVYLYFGQNGPGAGIMINGDVVRGSTFFSGEISLIPQYNDKNFQEALNNEAIKIDAISRLVASFVSILNPHAIIFNKAEVEQQLLDEIVNNSLIYVPAEHLPELTWSDWKKDYLYGLQSLALEQIMKE
ncbi:ROK family protein (plasmid) [Niallia taxi]|uniref:ROK family transcriptional regulator n=1 Tax=Niallia taxi TaxID=2499688 RepID=UPI0021A37193|nr:ROK family protein [Niallia taxi]MCT2345634.1 ROK family protein [Niallia taxi]MDE5054241.1 ROK family protein [Niallia taxi]MED3961115.1 ROK family protein [Niallia taxi]WOD65036.1 ROK family protein [Niallia taxi]